MSILLKENLTHNNEEEVEYRLWNSADICSNNISSHSHDKYKRNYRKCLSVSLHPISCTWTYDLDDPISIKRKDRDKIEYSESYIYHAKEYSKLYDNIIASKYLERRMNPYDSHINPNNKHANNTHKHIAQWSSHGY